MISVGSRLGPYEILSPREELSLERQDPPLPVLRVGQPDLSAGTVNVLPPQTPDLPSAPAGQVGEQRKILKVFRKLRQNSLELGALEEALAGVILRQRRDSASGSATVYAATADTPGRPYRVTVRQSLGFATKAP